jgi:hypothetical protein
LSLGAAGGPPLPACSIRQAQQPACTPSQPAVLWLHRASHPGARTLPATCAVAPVMGPRPILRMPPPLR